MSREPENEDEERLRQRKLEEALEVKSLRRIVSAYLNYSDAADSDVKRSERSFKKLPLAHKALLSHYPLKFKRLRRCISANSKFIYSMLQEFEPPINMSHDMDTCEAPHCGDSPNEHGFVGAHNVCSCHSGSTSGRVCFPESDQACCEKDHSLGNTPTERIDPKKEVENEGHGECDGECKNLDLEEKKYIETCCGNDPMGSNRNAPSSSECLDESLQLNVPLVDVDKVRCIIRNVVRDWAAEGQKERDQCYNPILEELEALFPNRSKESPPACLVPGAGLGRLALEISRLGFVSQGNEFSYYMMICSSYILNHAQQAEEWELYPWIHSNCNSRSENDQLRSVLIPDIHPASAGITEGFSMCGGDFVEVYGDPNHTGVWDAVVTCFFLDTAHNIVEYIEIISKILKEGGVWINLCPLLYDIADMNRQEDEMSIELSLEDVKRVASHYGFKFEKEKTIETTYTTNHRSMMQNRYFAEFWTARKISGPE